ncbi:glycosyltransferase family A protein [Bacillus sp. FJAT-44742]|uniref:glycosyltransferase family A protein n=1 Tax=Bacillus sp. FJAT-44742 TaxID=2014005 RepID=UPI000C24779B|nr:glycosyltransferase family A protein [Bacillus sp. FJAT-44742]
MPKKKILVSIAFNNWGLQDKEEKRLTKEWIDYRMEVFQTFTLKSLKNQTNQDFITFVQYDQRSEELVQDALNQYEELPENIKFVKKSAFNTLVNKEVEGHDYFYLVRIDSDDMYHKDHIEYLHQHDPTNSDTVVITNKVGYIYDAPQDRLATIDLPSPPFYTIIYDANEYLEGKRIKLKGHLSVQELPHEEITDRRYLVIIHQSNTSTSFENAYDKQEIEDTVEKEEILEWFFGKKKVSWMDKLKSKLFKR